MEYIILKVTSPYQPLVNPNMTVVILFCICYLKNEIKNKLNINIVK